MEATVSERKKGKASSFLEPRDMAFSTVILSAKKSSLSSHVHVHILTEAVVCDPNASQKEKP